MRNEIMTIDLTPPPECWCQVRNQRRARQLRRITRRRQAAMAADMLRSVAHEAAVMAAGFMMLMGPLIIMGLLFGPEIP